MLEHMVLLIWGVSVLIGVLIAIRKYEDTHPNTTFSAEIWNKRSSPYEILMLTLKKAFRHKQSRWFVLLWVVIALAFVLVKYAVPIIFAPYISIGNAAPVAPVAVYVPSYQNLSDPQKLLEEYALEVPSALRAAGAVDTVVGTAEANSSVSIDPPEILQDLGGGEVIMRIGYRYNITGVDFGLQDYPDLVLGVEGSCTTEYGWLAYSGPSPSDTDVLIEIYHPFNDTALNQQVSLYNGGPPVAFFFTGNISDTGPPGNFTWAAIVSSTYRESYWIGTDPWYLTIESADPGKYLVKPKRPALSCWQNDVWSYRGYNSSITGLNSTALPGLNLPLVLQDIFAHFLGQPKIVPLSTRLGASALQSAATSQGNIFNASSSSVHADLTRLVFASYIATVNTLTDTTLFSTNTAIPNEVLDSNGNIQEGVGGFVIYSSDVTTLSVRALIVIPTLTLGLWIIFIVLLILPIPGKEVSTLAVKFPTDDKTSKPEKESQTKSVLGQVVQQITPSLDSKPGSINDASNV